MDEYGIKIDVSGQATVQRVYTSAFYFICEHVDEDYEVIKETLLGYPYVVIINRARYWPQLAENRVASLICKGIYFGDVVVLKSVKTGELYETVPLTEDEAYMLFAYCCRIRDMAKSSKLIDLTDIRYPYYNQNNGRQTIMEKNEIIEGANNTKCAIVIHPNGSISFEDFSSDNEDKFINEVIHSQIKDIFNIVHCKSLPEPYVLVVDDAGFLKNLEPNALASVFYGRIIVGKAIVFKEIYIEEFGEHCLALLDSSDVHEMLLYLGMAAKKLAKEFGYSDEDSQ